MRVPVSFRRIGPLVAASVVVAGLGVTVPAHGAVPGPDSGPRTAASSTPTGLTLADLEAATATTRSTAAGRVHPATSCASSSGISTLLTSGSLGTVDGNVYVGLSTMYMIVGHEQADILSCGGIPRIGERFYVRVNSSDVQGGGEPSLFTPALRLPASVYPAQDASNPIYCYAQRFTDGATDPAITCPNSLTLDAFAGAGFSGSFAWSNGHAYNMGQTKIPAGWVWYGYMPVVATKPLAGLGSAPADFLWAGGRVDYVGIPGTGYAYSNNPMTVSDRAPELGYVPPAATSITDTSAVLTARIFNFWKAGTAVMEYGATTSYGRTTVADTIPGNDPSFPGYDTSPLTATGLVPGTTYHWRVRFTQSNGVTSYGADQTFTTTGSAPAGVSIPGAPTGVTAVAGNRVATVTWAAPASLGGLPISGYTVTATPGGGTCATTGVRSCAIGGLTNGTAYRFSVVAANSLGNGPVSGLSSVVVPSTVPTVVRTVKVTYPKVKRTTVTWAGPVSNGGAAIRRYEVRFRISTTAKFSAWKSTGLGRATTFTTFLKRKTYYVQIRVVNVRGASPVVQVKAVPTK